ncbi:allatostatin A [Lasioglossum baleicum]|uniref:allatostatin A n=1 Tax=Lasioglossum baleicum TaxID=434251 RepID=UPI003FCC9952
MFKMKSRTSLLTSSVAFVCVVSVVSKPAAAMDETPASSLNLQHYNSLDSLGYDDSLPAKRAYTYVSEYKRLPVYNFGIGKRWSDNSDDKRGRQYSFGLGKRTRQYSFGLGKRNENQDYPLRMNLDYIPVESAFHSQENLDDVFEGKRAIQPYSFGLGKRAARASGDTSGKGTRPGDLFSQRYHFGLGKRISEDDEDSLE